MGIQIKGTDASQNQLNLQARNAQLRKLLMAQNNELCEKATLIIKLISKIRHEAAGKGWRNQKENVILIYRETLGLKLLGYI